MISVIVPVYNGAGTIVSCLNSIRAQQGVRLEILLIDDGSTDETSELCRNAAAQDGRIRLFHQENAGVSAARNRGLREAKGDYITFVDADDLLSAGALAILRNAMETGVDFVIGSHLYFRGPWRRETIHSPEEERDSLASLMCGKLFRRSILEETQLRFREDLPYGEDTVFNLQYGSRAARWKVLPDIVYHCRMGGSASSLRYYPNRAEIARQLVEAYRTYAPTADLPKIAARELTETMLHYLVHCPKAEGTKRAEEARVLLSPYLKESIITPETVRKKYRYRILLRKLKKCLRGCKL